MAPHIVIHTDPLTLESHKLDLVVLLDACQLSHQVESRQD